MIRYLQHKEIDKSKWDDCLQSSPNKIVYASSWYLDVVSPSWEALVEDDYKSIFPLCSRRKYGFDYLYQPHFTQQGGLFSREPISTEEKLKAFLDAIPTKFKLIEINLNSGNEISSFKNNNFNKRKTHHLELNSSIDELRKQYSENLKRNLKKAKQIDQKIELSNEIELIIELFRNERGKDIKQLGEKEYQTLIQIVSEASRRNLVEIISTKNEAGKLTAGAILLESYSSYIFLFSATGPESRETGSMALIIDHFIEKHQQENKVLDFEGSMDDHLSRFYKGFGSQEIVYLQNIKNTLPIPFRWFK